MVAHDIADTAYLIGEAATLTKEQWLEEISPGQVVLEWDGAEPGVGAVLGAVVWSKEVWMATIVGHDFPARESTQPEQTTPERLAAHHEELASRWSAMISDYAEQGRLGDTVIDALCDPPESFQLYGIVAHVLTYSAHRRQLARTMLARHGVTTRTGDPLDWMRGS
jgi:AraC family transcriptional regulator